MTGSALVGSWKLLLVQIEMADTGQQVDLYGSKPVGRAILTESYATFIITAGGRPIPTTESDGAWLFKSMMPIPVHIESRTGQVDHQCRRLLASGLAGK
jgi:hypothetical protein